MTKHMPDFNSSLLESLLEGAPDWLSSIFSLVGQYTFISTIIGIVIIGLTYFFPCYTRMNIGRKAGLQSDWMAYVPIAWDIYRLRMVNAPLWYLCFFGSTGILCFACVAFLCLLLLISMGSFGAILLLCLTLGFIGMRVYVQYRFYSQYYDGFGFDRRLAIMTFVPGYEIIATALDVLIAYSHSIQFGERRYEPRPESAPRPGPLGKGAITALGGMYKGGVFTIEDGEELAMGRENRDCQIIFDKTSPEVSSRHCTIRYQASTGQYIVTDYSKNGTFMDDGTRLPAQSPMPLSGGTIIYLGSKKNIFRLG